MLASGVGVVWDSRSNTYSGCTGMNVGLQMVGVHVVQNELKKTPRVGPDCLRNGTEVVCVR